MARTGIGIFWVGAICVAFHFHVLMGTGLLVWSVAVLYRAHKQRRQVRRALQTGAGLDRL